MIDATFSALPLPETSFGILTSDGINWRIAWQGDIGAHQFEGDIAGPVGAQFGTIRFDGAYPGDSITTKDPSHFSFDAVTNNGNPQVLTFTSTAQPINFYLTIDGRPAVEDTLFWSEGKLSTTDIMPFNLITANAQLQSNQKTKQALEFKSKKGDQTQYSLIPAPAPKAATEAGSSSSSAAKSSQ